MCVPAASLPCRREARGRLYAVSVFSCPLLCNGTFCWREWATASCRPEHSLTRNSHLLGDFSDTCPHIFPASMIPCIDDVFPHLLKYSISYVLMLLSHEAFGWHAHAQAHARGYTAAGKQGRRRAGVSRVTARDPHPYPPRGAVVVIGIYNTSRLKNFFPKNDHLGGPKWARKVMPNLAREIPETGIEPAPVKKADERPTPEGSAQPNRSAQLLHRRLVLSA